MVGEAACHVAQSGTPVTLALEVERSEQANVDAYLGSIGDVAAERPLLGSPFWNTQMRDGRSSRAMVDLLSRIRQLRQAGLGIEVFLFAVYIGTNPDAHMADNLSDYLRDHPGRAVLALTGDYHARTADGAPWDPAKRFMGGYLRQGGQRVVSLDYDGPPGTAWACMSKSDFKSGSPREVECGVTQVNREGRDPMPPPGIHLLAAPSPTGYDGIFTVPSLTASTPAAATPIR
jgi:hypothetical protein